MAERETSGEKKSKVVFRKRIDEEHIVRVLSTTVLRHETDVPQEIPVYIAEYVKKGKNGGIVRSATFDMSERVFETEAQRADDCVASVLSKSA